MLMFRNNKVNEAQHEKFENDKERDERNQRYEEMETLKQKLKDDEDLWSSVSKIFLYYDFTPETTVHIFFDLNTK